MIDVEKHYRDVSFKQVDLVHDSISFLGLSLQGSIKFIQRTYDST